MKTVRTFSNLLLGCILLAASNTTAHAAAYTWDGTSTTWTTLTAWSPDVSGGLTNADDVTFDSTGIANLTTAIGGSTLAVKSITFNSSSSYIVRLYNSTGGTTARQLTTGSITVSSGSHSIVGAQGGSGTTGSLLLTSGTYNIASGSTLTFDARLRHSGTTPTYSKTGLGTLVLNADNGGGSGWVHSGFTVSQGILQFAAANAYGNSGNEYTVSSGAALEITGGVSQGIGTGIVTLNGTGIGNNGALRSLSGNNSFTSSGSGEIVLGSNSSIGVDAGTLSIANVISGASRNLTKVGSGTLTLSGANTYSGSTTVTGGTLAVNGSLGNTTSVTVSTGATLQGSGTINSSVTIENGGTFAPGNSIESIAAGNVIFQSGSTFAYEFQTNLVGTSPGVAADLIDSTGTLDISSGTILTLADLAASTALAVNSKFTLISYTGAWNNGLFSYNSSTLADDSTFTLGANQWLFNYNDVSGGMNYNTEQTGATGYVTMTVIPEPGTTLLGGLGLLFLLRRRR